MSWSYLEAAPNKCETGCKRGKIEIVHCEWTKCSESHRSVRAICIRKFSFTGHQNITVDEQTEEHSAV